MAPDAIGDGAPPEIEDLFRFLIRAGFAKRSERRGGMGGVRMVLEGLVPEAEGSRSASVEISCDRGSWSLRLRMAGMSEFFHPMVWRARIDGTQINDMDVAAQAGFIKARLQDVAAAVRDDPAIEAALARIGSQYMRRRYPWIDKIP